MTHHQALNVPGHGLPRTGCAGRLVMTDVYPDRHLNRSGAVEATVVLYACESCGATVSLEHRQLEPPEGTHAPVCERAWSVRNSYPARASAARGLVVALAEALTVNGAGSSASSPREN